jgi:hypothetical protein
MGGYHHEEGHEEEEHLLGAGALPLGAAPSSPMKGAPLPLHTFLITPSSA